MPMRKTKQNKKRRNVGISPFLFCRKISAEICGLIDIAAFSHDTVRKSVKEKAVRFLPHPLNECRQGKTAKMPVAVLGREKAHFPDLQVILCL